MISLAEFLICFALLTLFVVYAVSKSRGVRIFTWTLLAVTLLQALLPAG